MSPCSCQLKNLFPSVRNKSQSSFKHNNRIHTGKDRPVGGDTDHIADLVRCFPVSCNVHLFTVTWHMYPLTFNQKPFWQTVAVGKLKIKD